jgi:hypothetical protein
MSKFTLRPSRATAVLAGFFLLVLGSSQQAAAQVGIGTTTPDANAVLDLQSSGNDKGLLIPRLSNAQRLAIANPPDGLMIFQTDGTTGFWYYFGGAWTNIPNASTAGDNLGSHTATQNLNLTDKLLVGGTAATPGTSGLAISSAGRVGINTTSPAAKLDIQGGADSGGLNDLTDMSFSWRNAGYRHWLRTRHNSNPTSNGNAFDFYLNNSSSSTGSVAPGLTSTTPAANTFIHGMTLDNNGGSPRLGIGTTTPSATLHVSGTTSTVKFDGLTGTGTRVVTTDASGNLGSTSTASLADNLGNHTATQALNLGANALVGNGGTSGISISSNGRIGLGTTAPGARLHSQVNSGSLSDLDNDYVFEDFRNGSNVTQYMVQRAANGTAAAPAALGDGTTTGINIGGYMFAPRISTGYPGFGYGETGIEGLYRGDGTTSLTELRFKTSSSIRMTLDPTGQLGIGTTSPTALLDVNGSTRLRGLAGTGTRVVTTDASGNLSSTTTASLADNLGNHNATTNVSLADNDLLLRGTSSGDTNHGLGYYGPSKLWNGVTVDGPVLYGFTSGILGTNANGTKRSVLIWNNSGNVGIGNTSPTQKLDVTGNTLVTGNSYVTGNVGIGTTSPDRPLTVQGSGTSNELLSFKNNAGTTKWHWNMNTGTGGLGLSETAVSDGRLFIQTGGNVGLGTTSPSALLDVNGPARVRSLTGTGTLLVTADANGNLGTTTAPSGESTTASNGLTEVGNDVQLGGTLSAATTIANGGNNLNVTGTGNVGIGTSAPTEKLHVEAGSVFVNGEGTGLIVDSQGAKRIGLVKYASHEAGIWRTLDANNLFEIGRVQGVTSLPGTPTGFLTDLAVNNDGNVGIGTAAPEYKLHVKDGSIFVQGEDQGVIIDEGPYRRSGFVKYSGHATGFWRSDGYQLEFGRVQGVGNTLPGTPTGLVTDMTLDTDGDLGLGVTNPQTRLHVAGTSGTSNVRLESLAGTGTRVVTADASGNLSAATVPTGEATTAGNGLTLTGTQVQLGGTLAGATTIANGGNSFNITGTGNVGIGTSSPNARLDVLGSETTTHGFGAAIGLKNNAATVGNSWYMRAGAAGTSTQDGGLSFADATNYLLQLTSTGRVGVMTTAPTATFDVEGTARVRSLTATGTKMVTADANGNLGATTLPTGESTTASNGLTISGSDVKLGGTLSAATTVAQAGNMLSFTGGKIGLGTSTDPSTSRVNVVAGSATENALFAKIFDNTSTANSLKLEHNGSNLIVRPATAGGSVSVVENSAGSLALNPNAGNVGVGTTSPSATFDVNGTTRLRSLTATGTRMVTADANGNLGNAALPTDAQTLSIAGSTISLTNGGSVTVPSSADNLGNHTATTALNLAANSLVGNGGTTGITIAANGNVSTAAALSATGTVYAGGGVTLPSSFGPDATYVGTTGNSISFGHTATSEDFIGYKANTFYLKDSPGGGDGADPNLVVGGLAGTGSRVVVADANGLLSATATLPTGESTTASNGLTEVGNDVQLGGTLSAATTIANGGNNLSITGTGSFGLGITPTAKLHVSGAVKIESNNVIELGAGVTKEANAGKIGYNAFASGALDIVGAGTTTANRKIKLWSEGGLEVTGGAKISGLATGGTAQMVTASTDGTLATAAVPTGESTVANNGLTMTGSTVQLGGSLTGPTAIANAGNSLSITGTGNVGIGTTASSAKLQVTGTGTDVAILESSSTVGTWLGLNNTASGRRWSLVSTGSANSEGAGRLLVRDEAAGAVRATFDTNGNLGLGTASPNSTLQVNGAVAMPYTTTGAATSFTLTNAHQTLRRFSACATITIPQPSTCAGRIYTLINSNGTGSNVNLTVSTSGTVYDDVVNATITALAPNNRITIQSDGTDWIVVGR